MSKDYVAQRDDGYWIAGKRISLASLVYEFQRGAAPESILRSFPLLTLEEIYGAITSYLSNREEIVRKREAEFDEQRRQERETSTRSLTKPGRSVRYIYNDSLDEDSLSS